MKCSIFHRIIGIIILLIISLASYSQIFTKPNDSWGTTQNRGNPDSTQYVPTFPSAPVDSMGLHSQGFNGAGQKLKKAAIYYDSTHHKGYFWDPSSKIWILIGAGTGQNIGNSDLITTANRHLSGSDRHTFSLDSLKEFFLNDSLGRAMIDVDPFNQFISIGGRNSSGQQSGFSLDGVDGQIFLSAANGIGIGSPVPAAPALFTLLQRADQGPFNTNLWWPVLNKIAGDTIATLQDVRTGNGLVTLQKTIDNGNVLSKTDTVAMGAFELRFTGTQLIRTLGPVFAAGPSYTGPVAFLGYSGNGTNAFGSVTLQEWTGSGTDYVSLQPPLNILSSYTLNLPEGNDGDTVATKAYARSIVSTAYIGPDTVTTITSGTSSTVPDGTNIIRFNNTSPLTYTLTLGTNWHSSHDLLIAFTSNGTITNGNPMVTLTVVNGSGHTQSFVVDPSGVTYKAGENIGFHLIGTVEQRVAK